MHKTFSSSDLEAFAIFGKQEKLSQEQLEKFKKYANLLVTWNERFNITAITQIPAIITDHFKDSLACRNVIDIKEFSGVVDVGSGGGFPGIPLAICYAEKPIILLEVNEKKLEFLAAVKDALSLQHVELCALDWRTFLRKKEYGANLFCSRASLAPEELVRMFQPSCRYNKATLIYWASTSWQAGQKEKPFYQKEFAYTNNHKKRKLVFFTRA